MSNTDLTSAVAQFEIRPAELVVSAGTAYEENTIHTQEPLMNPRLGVDISKYIDNCQTVAESAMAKISELIASASSILVLGTEECMYPALILGRELEKQFPTISVKCHATTRSPIGICSRHILFIWVIKFIASMMMYVKPSSTTWIATT